MDIDSVVGGRHPQTKPIDLGCTLLSSIPTIAIYCYYYYYYYYYFYYYFYTPSSKDPRG